MLPKYSAEVIDDLLVFIDENGQGCDSHELTTFAAANHQLLRWRIEHRFNYAKARQELVEFFGRSNCPAYIPPRSSIISREIGPVGR